MTELATLGGAVERTFYTFRADQRLFGIDVAHVREVSTQTAVTPVPQAPPNIRGLTNLRSRIYLVLDPRPSLGLPPADTTAASRLVVLQAHVAEHLGLLVDRGGEIVRVAPGQIEEIAPVDAASAQEAPEVRHTPVVGVCKLEHELMMIIDPARLVAAAERAIG